MNTDCLEDQCKAQIRLADLHWFINDITRLEYTVRQFMVGGYDCILIQGYNKEDAQLLKEYAQKRWPHIPFVCSYLVFQMEEKMDQQIYYVVHFHADGGQMCVPGRRVFTDSGEAVRFADEMRAEPNHACGPGSVNIEATLDNPGDDGAIYPAVASAE